MVSTHSGKTFAKSTRRSPKTISRRAGRSSPAALINVAYAATSIKRSIRSSRRSLIKLFGYLPFLHTPKMCNQGFRRLPPTPDYGRHITLPPPSFAILPPLKVPGRKTVIFDLDETLIHSCAGLPPNRYDFTVHPKIHGEKIIFYVLKRPGAEELLRAAARSFEVVIFTAGLKEYASLVLDWLDPEGTMITHRLFRDSCREAKDGMMVKDLSYIGRDLGKVMIVDDNPASYALQKENAIPVSPFIADLGDRELLKLIQFLDAAAHFEDTRDAVKFYLAGQRKKEKQVIDFGSFSHLPQVL